MKNIGDVILVILIISISILGSQVIALSQRLL